MWTRPHFSNLSPSPRGREPANAAGPGMKADPDEASGDDEVREVVSRRYHELYELVQELAGVDDDQTRAFLATGLLCNLAVTPNLTELVPEKFREKAAFGNHGA